MHRRKEKEDGKRGIRVEDGVSEDDHNKELLGNWKEKEKTREGAIIRIGGDVGPMVRGRGRWIYRRRRRRDLGNGIPKGHDTLTAP